MVCTRSPLSITVALLMCLIPAALAAAPTQPGGSEAPSYRDPCENAAKYMNADYDRDGLSGYQECQLGTNPDDDDTDDDKLSDPEELTLGTDPASADTDGDEATDCWEARRASQGWPADPLTVSPDSDGDGLWDALEGFMGLNPGNIDTDQDMRWDSEEQPADHLVCHNGGTAVDSKGWENATNPDVDGDGLMDGVELKSIGTQWFYADTDHDGYSDGDEVLKWGTDPLDPNDPSTSNPPDYHP